MSAPDTITFARGMLGLRYVSMAKRIHVEGGRIVRVDPSPQATLFEFREVEANDLTSLMRAVWTAAMRGEIAIRGKPIHKRGRRAIYPDPAARSDRRAPALGCLRLG